MIRQLPCAHTKRIEDIFRMQVIRAGQGFTEPQSQVHGRMLDEERLLNMNYVRPANGLLNLRVTPVGKSVAVGFDDWLNQRETKISQDIIRLRTIRVFVSTGQNAHVLTCSAKSLNSALCGYSQTVAVAVKAVQYK